MERPSPEKDKQLTPEDYAKAKEKTVALNDKNDFRNTPTLPVELTQSPEKKYCCRIKPKVGQCQNFAVMSPASVYCSGCLQTIEK